MALIIRNRTIRPSTRDPKSPYRIKVENAQPDDDVVIFIDHESADFRAIYKCNGEVFSKADSIHFRVEDNGGDIQLEWRAGVSEMLVKV